MKKLTTLMMACMLVLTVFAGEKDKFSFGVRLGGQFSDVEGDFKKVKPFLGAGDWKRLIGPTMGFVFEIPVLEYFEIRPEINFASQGNRAINGDVVLTTWLGYVQVPLLLRGQYGSDVVRGFVHAGPQLGYGIFVFDRLRNGDEVIEKTSDSFSDRNWKPLDVGFSIGAGVEFPSAKNLELEVRYYKGFTDFNDVDVQGASALKNNSLTLSLGVKF
jgi:opacity protein-like surface antigen